MIYFNNTVVWQPNVGNNVEVGYIYIYTHIHLHTHIYIYLFGVISFRLIYLQQHPRHEIMASS